MRTLLLVHRANNKVVEAVVLFAPLQHLRCGRYYAARLKTSSVNNGEGFL